MLLATLRMKPQASRWVGALCAVTTCLVVLAATLVLLRVGLYRAQHVFWKLMDFALLLGVSSALFEANYKSIIWKDRPDKRRRLRIVRLLVVLLVVLAIPIALINWLR